MDPSRDRSGDHIANHLSAVVCSTGRRIFIWRGDTEDQRTDFARTARRFTIISSRFVTGNMLGGGGRRDHLDRRERIYRCDRDDGCGGVRRGRVNTRVSEVMVQYPEQ